MRIIFLLIALLISATGAVSAQEVFLPVSTTSEKARTVYYKAMEAAHSSDIPTFQEQIKAATEEDPAFFMAWFQRVLSSYFFGQPEAAKELTTSALNVATDNLNAAELALRQVLAIMQEDPAGDVSGPLRELAAAYGDNPQTYEIGTLLAWIQGDKDAALANAKKLTELRPDFGTAFNMLGYSHMALQQMDEAQEAFEAYLRLSPDDANAYDSMGEYYMNVKDFEKSAEYYQKAADMGMASSKERAEKARSMIKN